jgi:hypothetical protein
MFQEREELLEVYRSTPVTLSVLVRNVTDRALRTGGDGDEGWSIIEVVCHLRDAEERSFARVKRMCEEDRPRLEAYDPAELAQASGYRQQPLDVALAAFGEARAQHTAFLESADDSRWARVGIHEEIGEISVQQLTSHMAAHDAIHLAQISRRISGADEHSRKPPIDHGRAAPA